MIPLLILLTIVVYFDARLLRQGRQEKFEQYFGIRPWVACIFLAACLALVSVEADKIRLSSIVNVIILLPLYLLRRQWFLKDLPQELTFRFWIAVDCFGVVLYWIFGGVLIATLIGGLFTLLLDFESELGELLLSAMGSSVLLIYLVSKASARFSGKGFWENVGLVPRKNSFLRLYLLPAASGFLFAALSTMLIHLRSTAIETPLSEIIGQTQSVDMILLFLGMALLAAPLVEEIVFRGYFFQALKELKGLPFTIAVISLSFAALHVGQYWGDWTAILMIAILGFCLSGLRAWTRSTIPSTVMHYVYNFSVTLIPVLIMSVTNPAFFEYQYNYPHLETQEKVALLERALREDGQLADAHYELALIYLDDAAEPEAALEAVDRALRLYPDQRSFRELKADILERLGRFSEALEIRRRLLEESRA